jgi:anti-sigma B factor antagonist
MAQPTTGRIEVSSTGNEVRIRVTGRATHIISQPLREYAWQMVRRGSRNFFIDLGDCLYIDSTFAGVLVGMSMKLKDVDGSLTLQRVPARCAELFATLGVETLFTFDEQPPAPSDIQLQALPMAARSREAWAGTILEAHRLLAEAERANESRFEDVIDFLKSELPPGRDPGKFKN